MGQYTNRHDSVSGFDPGTRLAAEDAEFLRMFPALFEFLAERIDEQGRPRVTSTLMVSLEEGLWKLALTDRAQQGGKFDYKLWKSGLTFREALASVDAALQDGSAEWRKFPKWEKEKRR